MLTEMFQSLWLLLTYSYNVILVLFIATHLFVGAIISFLSGLYIGVYLSQNYQIPRINEPRHLWGKFLSFLESNRRDPQKVSVGNILQTTTIKSLVLEDASASRAILADESESPSKTERILVPERSPSASFTQAASQTEIEDQEEEMLPGEDLGDDIVDVDEISGAECAELLQVGLEDFHENPEPDTDATLTANSISPPVPENATTLILTEPEDLTEEHKSLSSSQIVEASLTLNKDTAISRSNTKLNQAE